MAAMFNSCPFFGSVEALGLLFECLLSYFGVLSDGNYSASVMDSILSLTTIAFIRQ
uniref:Uncharacterized protein n=1 Tax=Arundo donax TaxID=35708 RepID=A0A0A9CT02_ARUDO